MIPTDNMILRIQKMELYFDTLQSAADIDPALILKEAPLHEMLEELLCYYTGGQWLRDYEADERGELPSDLKRGVLSQDGIDSLLTQLSQNHKKID